MATQATDIPEGWSYDRGDPDAGIFGDQWIHEACKVLAGPGNTELEGCSEISKQLTEPDKHGMATFIYTITCHDCGDGIVVERDEPVMVDDFDPQVGDVVCDCRMRHLPIIARDGDEVTLKGGWRCSLYHCCSPANHVWKHEDVVAEATRDDTR